MYVLVLAAVIALALATTAAAPTWSAAVQRDREAELLFRLAQYRTAIARFRADHNRYPRRLEDLLVDTTQLVRRRYLRRLYTDPMTGKPDWALDIVRDRTGASSGIRNLHSRSTGIGLRTVDGEARYSEW